MRILKFVFFLLLTGFNYADPEPLRITYASKANPISWMDGQTPRGLFIDVMEEVVTNRLGIPIRHRIVPWARAQYMVKHNQADGFITITTKDRQSFTNISQIPIVNGSIIMAVNIDNPRLNALTKVTKIDDLKAFRVGVHLGDGWAKEHLKEINVIKIKTFKQLLDMLASKRIDILIQSTLVSHIIKKNLKVSKKVVILPNALDTITYNLMIRKNSKYAELPTKFDKELKKLINNGDFKKIQDRYL